MAGNLIHQDLRVVAGDTHLHGSHNIIAKTSDSVFVKEGHVYRIYSELNTGINEHSGKRYWRWSNESVKGFRTTKSGLILAYSLYGSKQHSNVDYVWDMLSSQHMAWDKQVPVFKQAIKDVLGITSFHDVYPVAKHYGLDGYRSMPTPFVSAFRSNNAREFTERVFGKSHYRRDLLKAVANVQSMPALNLARGFRGLVPTDWIINYLKFSENVRDHYGDYAKHDLKPLLRELDPRSYRHLLQPTRGADFYNAIDAFRMFQRNGWTEEGRYFRSWEDMHNAVMPRYTYRRQVFEDQEIKPTTLAKKITGLSVNGMEIIPAAHTSILVEWGQAMHNCIGGYRRQAVDGQGVYAGVYEGNKLIANLEIVNGRLTQLLGPCNKSLPDSKKQALETVLKEKGVKTNQYWGM